MSKKIIASALTAIITIGLGSQAMAADQSSMAVQNKTKETLTKEMPKGFEKCYGIAKAGKNDCASGTNACAGQSQTSGSKSDWIGVPKGTCDKILNGSTTAS